MDFNPLAPEVVANPYPYYTELRNRAPVTWLEPFQCWALSRYADVDFALRNPQIFSSSVFTAEALGDLNPVPEVPWILDMIIPGYESWPIKALHRASSHSCNRTGRANCVAHCSRSTHAAATVCGWVEGDQRHAHQSN